MTIPGVSATAAHVIIAEIGVDMSRFATAAHLRSWAGLCPQLNESAGKVMSRRLRKGAPWLKTVLVQCAWAATRTKNSYLHAQFLRLRARRGPNKAILAVAASILTAAYYLLRDQLPYRDLGPLYFARLDQERTAQRLARRISELGYEVEIRKPPDLTLTPLFPLFLGRKEMRVKARTHVPMKGLDGSNPPLSANESSRAPFWAPGKPEGQKLDRNRAKPSRLAYAWSLNQVQNSNPGSDVESDGITIR